MNPQPARVRQDAEVPASPPRQRAPARAVAPAVRLAAAVPASGPAGILTGGAERLALPARPPAGQRTATLRDQLEAILLRTGGAASWLESSKHYAGLVNGGGSVPVTARLEAGDLEFLSRAREELRGFADLGLMLIELHQPLDAGGISSDPASPIQRCRNCMCRWPCPTFRTISEVLDRLENT
ncbi:MAG TPA: hypothetical protein VMK13_10520 [Streptosporangiaceae bacterium]|nr:hypothetical protein [Streptosporangiaceae bacterium]